MTRKHTLNRDDWIKAGFRALSAGGPQAIKIEAIARELQVSKGSFYWHFKDAAALKDAMLRHWTQIATKDIIEAVEGSGQGPEQQLRLLVQIATSQRSEPYGGTKAEPAIRDWARYDKNVAATLKIVDTIRLQFLKGLFEKNGNDPARSRVYANILYAALIGLEQLSHQGVADREKHLSGLLKLLLRAPGGVTPQSS